MSPPSLSRTSSFASISSIFSEPTDYVIVPQNSEQLHGKLSKLSLPDDEEGNWRKISSALSDVLCDPRYRISIATYMEVYHAVWQITFTPRVRDFQAVKFRQNLQAFLTTYLDGVREIADELGDDERRDSFLRERRTRYLQVMRYSSHMFSNHDGIYVSRENCITYHGSLPPIEGLFHIAWYGSKLPVSESVA